MIIANPLYDVVFKNLMEDNRIATFFLETLLEETIESLVLSPQEYSMLLMYQEISEKLYQSKRMERMGINLIRLDYVATIRLKSGKTKKVLIEIQKARNEIDVMRFRNYLAEHYKKEDELVIKGKLEKVALPIVTIYILGFDLHGINSSAVKVDRNYVDLLTKSVIPTKSNFIEQLTHDSYVIQLKRIESKFKTRLERMLTVFEQRYFTDETGMIKQYFPDESNEAIIGQMVEVLHFSGTDPASRKKIEDEREAERFMEVQFGKQNRKLMEVETELKEKELQLEEKDRTIFEKDQTIEAKDKILDDKDKSIEEMEKSLEGKDKSIEEMEKIIALLKTQIKGK